MTTHPQSNTCTETCGPQTDREEGVSREILPSDTNEDQSASEADQEYVTTVPVRKSVDWSDSVDDQQTEENIMQISGKGHWFLGGLDRRPRCGLSGGFGICRDRYITSLL